MAKRQQTVAPKPEVVPKQEIQNQAAVSPSKVCFRFENPWSIFDDEPSRDPNQIEYLASDYSKQVARGVMRGCSLPHGNVNLVLYRISDTPDLEALSEPWYTFVPHSYGRW